LAFVFLHVEDRGSEHETRREIPLHARFDVVRLSGASDWLFTPVAASCRPSVPSKDGVNDVLYAA
jgi:hypothetical protein